MLRYRRAICFKGVGRADVRINTGTDMCIDAGSGICIDTGLDASISTAGRIGGKRFGRDGLKKQLPLAALFFASLVPLLIPIGCANPAGDAVGYERFSFTVVNVGQGLAQFGVVGKDAVAWDVGDQYEVDRYGGEIQYKAWYSAYKGLGSPRVRSIIISHSHKDHYGMMQRAIDKDFDWSGEIVVSPYEDTAGLRKLFAAQKESPAGWTDRVKFKLCARGDTLRTLAGVDIVCLWPPRGLDVKFQIDGADKDNENDNENDNDMKNHYSLVFSVRHGSARALVTSDIDAAAMAEIAAHSRYDLRAQILPVPHHGSRGSVNPLFFAYVAAEVAVISCSYNNTYGHPSGEMLDELERRAGRITRTDSSGTATFGSNGFYWNF